MHTILLRPLLFTYPYSSMIAQLSKDKKFYSNFSGFNTFYVGAWQ